MNYIKLLGIGIPEVLMNIISWHGYRNKIKSTVILLCCTELVEYYTSKGLIIIEHSSKNLSSIPNEAKQITHVIHIYKDILLWIVTQKLYL